MRKLFLLATGLLMVVASGSNMANAEELSAARILAAAFANYNLISSEIEYSQITSTNWGTDQKVCTCWIRRDAGKKEMMFVLNHGNGLRPKPDGAIIKSVDGAFDLPVVFQKRRSIKLKNSGYDDFSNGTELNYFDLMRLGGETISSLREVSFWNGVPDRRIPFPVRIAHSIKALSKNTEKGDYAFRVFHIGIIGEMPVILAIECFDFNQMQTKLQINFDFERLETNSTLIIRERRRKFVSASGSETMIEIFGRKMDASFGRLDEIVLGNGGPK